MRHKKSVDWVAFGQAVRACRGGVPRAQVAAVVGVSDSMLQLLEEGKRRPNAEIYLSLCSWLSRDPLDFVLTPVKIL